ncbi:IBR finger domain protein [Aspergillus unguis]
MSPKRSILITGCSDRSLGSHLALQFHFAGWRVFASARNMAKLKDAEKAGIETVQLDTLSDESIAACVSTIEKLTAGTGNDGKGSLDALLNNAGAGYSMPLMDIEIDKAKQLFDLNVWSLISVSRAFLPLLMNSPHAAKDEALLINHTSVSGIIAGTGPFAGSYNMSKAAASSMTETLRRELQPFGIRVINLITGAVQSNFHDNAGAPVLPATSLYNLAKEKVEESMINTNHADDTAAEQWAKNVVRDMTRPKPAFWIWRGKLSTYVWMATYLPIGLFNGVLQRWVGLDIVERRYKEQKRWI